MEKECFDIGGGESICKSKKLFHVGVSKPWGQNRLMWDVAENIDFLSPDLLAKGRGVNLPLLRIEAFDEEEAVREYKAQVPEVKNWRLIKGWK